MKKERTYELRNENAKAFMNYVIENGILAFITDQNETHTTFKCLMTDLETQKAKAFCESIRKKREEKRPTIRVVEIIHIFM